MRITLICKAHLRSLFRRRGFMIFLPRRGEPAQGKAVDAGDP